MANNYNFQPVNSQAQQFSNNQLVESIVDFAETPEEKEIVRKHIDKIHNI